MSFITTQATDHGFDYWSSQPFLKDETKRKLNEADAILVPQEGFRGNQEPTFPVCTEEIFQFVRERLDGQATADIAIEDEDYKEVALHSALLIIGAFVVTSLVAPVLTDVVSEYIKRRIYGDAKGDRTNVRFSLTVEERIAGSARRIAISYDGPASEFHTSMKNAIAVEVPKLKQDLPKLDGTKPNADS